VHNDPIAVSVVIPTTGERSLKRTVQSALEQRGVTVEVVVVMNGRGKMGELVDDARVRVIHSDPALKGNGARSLGIAESRHPLVALLDDDDYWQPDKLLRQYNHVQSAKPVSETWVVSCAVNEHSPTHPSRVVPTEDPEPLGDIAEYLARRPKLLSIGQQFQSSTLLFPRALGLAVPFDPAAPVHQDWGWVIDAQRNGAAIFCLYEPLSHRVMGSLNAITSSIKWRESLRFGTRMLANSSRRARGDFALTIAADRAIAAHDYRGWLTCGWTGITKGTPGLPAIIFYFSLIVRPRRSI
jgi:glycosyltransferase involved in cell wall biosynthesis